MLKVALVGKQNVGKSTLFNKLTKQRNAITLDRKGVTRDVLCQKAVFSGKEFLFLDTAGFHPKIFETVERASYAIKGCDVIVFVVGNKIDDQDQVFVTWLRKNANDAKIILVQNKSDLKEKDCTAIFGFETVFNISAERSEGIKNLLRYLASIAPKQDIKKETEEKKIRIAIFGRPNVGKSTLMNKLLKEERSLVQDQAGTTRDPVKGSMRYDNINFDIADTAGLRKRSKVQDKVESFSNYKSIDTIRSVDVCIFLFDAANFALEKQDYTIINKILDSSKPVVLVANKIDKVKNKKQVLDFINLQSNKLLLDKISLISMSSLHDEDFGQLIDCCKNLFAESKKEVKTTELNNWLKSATQKHKHPFVGGKEVKFKYITKVKNRMIFVLMCNHPKLVKESYLQYIKRGIGDSFGITG